MARAAHTRSQGARGGAADRAGVRAARGRQVPLGRGARAGRSRSAAARCGRRPGRCSELGRDAARGAQPRLPPRAHRRAARCGEDPRGTWRARCASACGAIEVAWSIDSTNSVLLERANPPAGSGEVLLAEYQSAGRGRRGRSWLAPPGRGDLPLAELDLPRKCPQDLGALGLVIGVCVLRALKDLGLAGLRAQVAERSPGAAARSSAACSSSCAPSPQVPPASCIGIGLNVALGRRTPARDRRDRDHGHGSQRARVLPAASRNDVVAAVLIERLRARTAASSSARRSSPSSRTGGEADALRRAGR